MPVPWTQQARQLEPRARPLAAPLPQDYRQNQWGQGQAEVEHMTQ